MSQLQPGKWCLVDKGPDDIDLKWICGTTSTVKWYSALGGPITRLYLPKDGDKLVMAEGRQGRPIKLSIASYCVPESCGESADCFSQLNNSMGQEEFLNTFQKIKDSTFSDGMEVRKPLEALQNKKSNTPFPMTGKGTTSVMSPVKLFESVSRSPGVDSHLKDKSPNKIVRNINQRRKRLFGAASGSSIPELQESCSETLEEPFQDNQATVKRQRVSVQHSKGRGRSKRRDFPQAVIAMREALTTDMGKEMYDELAVDQFLPNPSKTVKTKWQEILGCQNFTQVTQNAREYKLAALLSKRCWDKVLHIFQLCKDNGIATQERQANVIMFRPLRGMLEEEMYTVLSKYAGTPFGTAKDVKTVIAEATELGKDRSPSLGYREMKSCLAAFQREGMTLEVAAKQREQNGNLQAQVYQLRMFALDVALTANNHSISDAQMRHDIKNLLEIDSYLDPDTGGFAAEISLSKVEGDSSVQSSHDDFNPPLSSTRLHGDDDWEEEFDKEAPVASPQKEAPVASPQKEAPVASPQKEAPVASSQKEAPVASPQKEAPDFIFKDGWVAVALEYPEGWHIGKVEQVQDEKVVVTFLEPGPSGHYRWPVRQDVLLVHKRCVLVTDVQLSCCGTGTRQYWIVPATVRSFLNDKFAEFRSSYW